MASMRDIKRRRDSVESTGQITKAMKLVSTVKLQKARVKAENAKPYFDYMYGTVNSILAKTGTIHHPYLDSAESAGKAVIVISSNRGLAGGYNNNVGKLVAGDPRFTPENTSIYSIGLKGREYLKAKGYRIQKDFSDVINEPLVSDAREIGNELLELFSQDQIGEIYIAYTVFRNTVSQVPTLLKLLPVDVDADVNHFTSGKDLSTDEKRLEAPMTFEPEAEETLEMIIPKYLNSIIYGALIEAVASENGARMSAMDSATSNAEEIIDKLSLQYNRARQSAITQELTEIVAGAEAINN